MRVPCITKNDLRATRVRFVVKILKADIDANEDFELVTFQVHGTKRPRRTLFSSYTVKV